MDGIKDGRDDCVGELESGVCGATKLDVVFGVRIGWDGEDSVVLLGSVETGIKVRGERGDEREGTCADDG